MEKHTLKAEQRKVLGKKVGKLRKDGVLPANIYGKGIKSQAVQVEYGNFEKVFKEVGETGLVDLQLEKEKRTVLVHNVQRDPVSDFIIHADFLQVDLKQKVTASVPIEVLGKSPAEKQGLGTIVQYIDEIEVEALPAELPEKFEVDISKLMEVDDAVYVKDLPFDKNKVEIKADLEEIIVKVEPLRREEEKAPPEEVVTEEGAQEGVAEGEEVRVEEEETEKEGKEGEKKD